MIVEPPGVEDATGHVAAMYDAAIARGEGALDTAAAARIPSR